MAGREGTETHAQIGQIEAPVKSLISGTVSNMRKYKKYLDMGVDFSGVVRQYAHTERENPRKTNKEDTRMRFDMKIQDRKVLAARLEDLVGKKRMYTGVPRCAYQIGDYSVEKDGHIEVDEDKVSPDIIRTLLDEGMIEGEVPEEPAAPAAPAEAEEGQEAQGEENAQEDSFPGTDIIKPNIAFPMAGHSGRSIKNLLNLLYSRGKLISKATAGSFGVTEALAEKLRATPDVYGIDKVMELIREFEAENGPSIIGLSFEGDRLIFNGFPPTPDPEEIQAYMQLAALMNNQSIEQNRIQGKLVDDSNEKYSMRTWLIRIGMKGDEYKRTRSLLMGRLSGHTAFRTDADAERWRERERERRHRLKEQKEAVAEQVSEVLEASGAMAEQDAGDGLPEEDREEA